jgi:flagellar biosynthetic protein FliO
MSLKDGLIIVFDVFLSVAGFKKKTLVFSITVLFGAGVLVVFSAQTTTNSMEAEKTRPDSNQPQEGSESKNTPLFTNDPNFFGGPDYKPVIGEFSIRAILAVFFVLALFITAIYVSRKLLPKITNLPGREIRIIETVHIGPRKAVHVLEVDNRRFLIGSTNENVTKLADLGGDLTDLSAKQANYN